MNDFTHMNFIYIITSPTGIPCENTARSICRESMMEKKNERNGCPASPGNCLFPLHPVGSIISHIHWGLLGIAHSPVPVEENGIMGVTWQDSNTRRHADSCFVRVRMCVC